MYIKFYVFEILPILCIVVLSIERPIVGCRIECAVSAHISWNVLRVIWYNVFMLGHALPV